jgi:hypothetical protein
MTTPDYRALCAELADMLECVIDSPDPRCLALVARARILLAAPEAVGVSHDEINDIARECVKSGKSVEWAILQGLSRYGTAHPAPVPVGSSLWRQEGWCDTEGYCWAFFNRRWELWQPACLDATVLLLPHWALPFLEAQP